MLGSVLVTLNNDKGLSMDCKAILDSGSQLNLITERAIRQLRIKGVPDFIPIEGIGSGRQQAQRRANLHLHSKINGFNTRLEAHILPRIISPQPLEKIDTTSWPIPKNIVLADQSFNTPHGIYLLIGAELFYSLLSVGQIKLGEGLPILQNTVLGWTVAGRVNNQESHIAVCSVCSKDETLEKQIERFWSIEEIDHSERNITAAEQRTETFFNHTTRRDNEGRFVVRLPFKGETSALGESRDIAYQRFLSIERKLSRNPDLKNQYVQFMQQYRNLGHMEEVKINQISQPYFFLPHHCVLKPESNTTKLRVVFDGSTKTSTNISLNDLLSKGPTLQDDLFSILLRFRTPRFVFTADIEKMYRQVKVAEEDQKYQLIWWRSNPDQRIRCYQLTTVTYGTTSAPYLATKCLQRLAEDEAMHYPLATEVLKRDFYVDDLLTGADSLTTALEVQQQLQHCLNSAGFTLRKWCANHHRLLDNIAPDHRALELNFDTKGDEHIKTIGLSWLPTTDDFSITTTWDECKKVTKRSAYSDIARLFDPLGIMGPVVVSAKIFLQQLWQLRLDWDAALPQELHTQWQGYREGLKSLSSLKFPRHVFAHRIPKVTQIHIFADASEKAYGAAAYVRSIDHQNMITVRLLCAKSRVAPIKSTTLPRLELCAAKLAAELAQRIKNDLKMDSETIHLWSDSEIVLAWINSPTSSFQTFVANRISQIQQLTNSCQWRHVKSKDNPADILSRGLSPERLASANLWFYGPIFLHGPESLWPSPYEKDHTDYKEERKKSALSIIHSQNAHFIQDIDHKNSFRVLQRIVAYVLRFIGRTRKSLHAVGNTLSVLEMDNALTLIVRAMQEQEFTWDIAHIKRHHEPNRNSPLNSLAPFLDEKGILRVGGRLEAANISYEAKHPVLLPYSHPFTKLLLQDIHVENCHAGPQTMLAISRQKFWPIKGKTIARSIVQNCVRCNRAKPKLLLQAMGNLPAHRVQPARPFLNAGVDFCGPIWTHFKVRGKRPQKSYIAVFCCFATKAVHLELVTDLSTQGFIGALKRFTARRGHCQNIYCDNATNFVGARNELNDLKGGIFSTDSQNRIQAACTSRGTDFHFIPPRAPHFGGLWEAAVKSAKHLLRRTLGAASLTYEELETTVVEVEAILNSRPITPLSSNPNDVTALTPGHFLIGEPLTSSIDPMATPSKVKLLSRWKLVSHVKEEFWRRWSNEYLNHLQHRYKWKQRCQNVETGTMVIIKEDNVPPLKWSLGRIVKTYKGNDDMVRVADVRTAHGIIRRAIHKLAPLPVEEESDPIEETSAANSVPSHQEPTEARCNQKRDRNLEDQPTSNDQDIVPAGPTCSKAQNRPKRSRLSLSSAILSLLLTCLIMPTTRGAFIEVTPFKSNPGIYFEGLGEVNIYSNEWNLIAYYDMKPYWKDYEAFKNHSNSLALVCESIKEKQDCSKIVQHIQHLIQELDKNNELLKYHVEPRRKRGAINFIGNMANALFGVLDSEYAEQMSKTIDGLQRNEIHLATLIKNQTSILDATLNVMKRDQETTTKHFEELESYIAQVTEHVNKVDQALNQGRITQLFTLIAIQVMLAGSNFQRVQSSILDVLIDTHHGKLNPQLISPKQLMAEMIAIRGYLPPSLRLPAEENEVLSLYNLMVVEARVTANHIIFRLKLPLVSSEHFEMFRIIPVPTLVNTTFLAIRPSTPYLVINLHRDQYYPLDEGELNFCIYIRPGRHLCKQRHPTYNKGSPFHSCEVNLLNHIPNSTSCEVTRVGDGPHWIQLHNPNQWIYVLREPTTINVVCGNNSTQQSIAGSGTLKLSSDCIIRQPLITIQGHHVFPSAVKTSYMPATNFTNFIQPERLEPLLKNEHHYRSHIEELEALKRQLHQLNHELPSQTLPYEVHQFTVGYTGLFLACIAAIVLIWKHPWKSCKKQRKPIPTPRTRPEPADNLNTSCGTTTANFDLESSI